MKSKDIHILLVVVQRGNGNISNVKPMLARPSHDQVMILQQVTV